MNNMLDKPNTTGDPTDIEQNIQIRKIAPPPLVHLQTGEGIAEIIPLNANALLGLIGDYFPNETGVATFTAESLSQQKETLTLPIKKFPAGISDKIGKIIKNKKQMGEVMQFLRNHARIDNEGKNISFEHSEETKIPEAITENQNAILGILQDKAEEIMQLVQQSIQIEVRKLLVGTHQTALDKALEKAEVRLCFLPKGDPRLNLKIAGELEGKSSFIAFDTGDGALNHHHGEDACALDLTPQILPKILEAKDKQLQEKSPNQKNGRKIMLVGHQNLDTDCICTLYKIIDIMTGENSPLDKKLRQYVHNLDLGKWKKLDFSKPSLNYLFSFRLNHILDRMPIVSDSRYPTKADKMHKYITTPHPQRTIDPSAKDYEKQITRQAEVAQKVSNIRKNASNENKKQNTEIVKAQIGFELIKIITKKKLDPHNLKAKDFRDLAFEINCSKALKLGRQDVRKLKSKIKENPNAKPKNVVFIDELLSQFKDYRQEIIAEFKHNAQEINLKNNVRGVHKIHSRISNLELYELGYQFIFNSKALFFREDFLQNPQHLAMAKEIYKKLSAAEHQKRAAKIQALKESGQTVRNDNPNAPEYVWYNDDNNFNMILQPSARSLLHTDEIQEIIEEVFGTKFKMSQAKKKEILEKSYLGQ